MMYFLVTPDEATEEIEGRVMVLADEEFTIITWSVSVRVWFAVFTAKAESE
jgi:hypothetical protein